MVRRWLANDTWELLGGPVPADAAGGAGGERAARVLAVVPGALADAWAAAVGLCGPDPRLWRWGDVHQAVRRHPLDGALGLAGVPMGGDADTIQAAGYGWVQGGPFTVASLSVYRQVVDLADPASASYVIPGGSSGDPGSPHFADQLAVWARHGRIPMRLCVVQSRRQPALQLDVPELIDAACLPEHAFAMGVVKKCHQ
jgi:penicillin amidase